MRIQQSALYLPLNEVIPGRHNIAPPPDSSNEDNGTWLITLADLMTMLLVFALIIFASFYANKVSFTLQPQAATTPPSLVSVALANPRNLADQQGSIVIPMRMRTVEPLSMQPHTDERIICRVPLIFADGAVLLENSHHAELQQLARLAKQNPAAKIIISSSMASQACSRSINIMHYLVGSCTLPKQNIFLQSLAAPVIQQTNLPAQDPVEIRLVKSFW